MTLTHKEMNMRTLVTALTALTIVIGLSTASAGEKKSTKKLIQTEYKVSGLTCEACEQHLTQEFKNLKGVKVDLVCSDTGKAQLSYDSSKVKAKDLIGAIKKAGFKFEGEKVSLNVAGMTCDGCSTKVNKALTALKGVTKVDEVCHESGHAVVTINPLKIKKEKLVAAITDSGFNVTGAHKAETK